jgi:MFS family permease
MTSYVVAKVDPSFTYETASWIYTGNMVARGIFTAVGGYLEWKIGTRTTVVIGCFAATYTVIPATTTSSFLLGFSFNCSMDASYNEFFSVLACGHLLGRSTSHQECSS